MQIFEFHFNPKRKEDLVFDSFVYEPENIYEQKLGNLYMVGELTNALPQNYQFLNSLALTIKNSFYHISNKSSPEFSLRNSLKDANKFLGEQEKKGNVDWLGNLNFTQINLKDLNLNFTKVGNIKVILCRERKIMDIGKELEKTFSENHPLKIFSKIITGKLNSQDKIIVLTKEAYDLFSKEDFFSEILLIFEKNISPKSIEGEIKNFLNKKRGPLSLISGVFILISLDSAQKLTVNIREPAVSKKKIELISPFIKKVNEIKNKKDLFLIPGKIFKKIIFYLKKLAGFAKILSFKNKACEKIKNLIPKTNFNFSEKIKFPKILKFKKIILIIFILLIVFTTGFYLSKKSEQKEIINFQEQLQALQEKINDAENALIYRDEKKANLLYQEAWKESLELSQLEGPLKEDFLEIKNSIEKELFALNKIIKNPELNTAFNFENENFSPQKIISDNLNLYFISNLPDKGYAFNLKQKTISGFDIPKEISLGAIFKDSLILLSENNKSIYLETKSGFAPQIIESPYSDNNFIDFTAFGSNLYFLELNKKEVIKFEFNESEQKIKGEIWFDSRAKKPDSPLSMAIDGSVWILNKNQTILKYYKGELKEEFVLDFFPYIEKPAKIITQSNFSYVYLLNPANKIISVLDKTGKLSKQYWFEDLSDIKDFIILSDEKTAYLINGLTVFEFKL